MYISMRKSIADKSVGCTCTFQMYVPVVTGKMRGGESLAAVNSRTSSYEMKLSL